MPERNGVSIPGSLPPDFPMTSFSSAIHITPSPDTPNIYIADIKRDWCIGLVPHGGYILSLLTHAATTALSKTHPRQNHPDIITAHIEFLSRASPGRAEIRVTELRLGRQFSSLRVQLFQFRNTARRGGEGGKGERGLVAEALVTLGDLGVEGRNGGVGLETRRVPGLGLGFEEEEEEGGKVVVLPSREGFEEWVVKAGWPGERPAALKMQTLFPRGSGELGVGEGGRSVREQWVRWREGVEGTGKGFEGEALGYVCDGFRPVPENYGLQNSWYPTLSYGLDVKSRPPPGGWEWLYVRAEIYEARNGRYMIDVVVCEEGGAVVCTSRHVALILGGEGNSKVGRREVKI